MTQGVPRPSDVFPQRVELDQGQDTSEVFGEFPEFIGERARRDGGRWHNCHARPERDTDPPVDLVARDQDSVFPKLRQVDRAKARARLRQLTLKAANGELSFEDGEGDWIRSAPPRELYELRVQLGKHAQRVIEKVELRLYYAEPEAFDGLLLAVGFAKKPSGRDVAGTQNRQIQYALGRKREHGVKPFCWGLEQAAS